MNLQAIEQTKVALHTHFHRLMETNHRTFAPVCQQVLNWLTSHPILNSLILHLEKIEGSQHDEIQLILDYPDVGEGRYFYISVHGNNPNEGEPHFIGYNVETVEQHASACYLILRAVTSYNATTYAMLTTYITQMEYWPAEDKINIIIDELKKHAVLSLYKYLVSQIESLNAVNGILGKYKSSVEWFQKTKVRDIANNGLDGKDGERALALHLQQYIFDQGIEYVIEPSSNSGEVDLLLRDANKNYLIIDTKYIKKGSQPSSITKKIADGLNQVARYCNDYNQYEGHLAVYVDDDISLQIEMLKADGNQYFKIGNHIIYYTEMNIADRPSASKSGKAKQIIITEDELHSLIEE